MGWVFNHKKKPGCPCKFFATENKEQNERESVFAAQYSAVPQYELREFDFFFEYVIKFVRFSFNRCCSTNLLKIKI